MTKDCTLSRDYASWIKKSTANLVGYDKFALRKKKSVENLDWIRLSNMPDTKNISNAAL